MNVLKTEPTRHHSEYREINMKYKLLRDAAAAKYKIIILIIIIQNFEGRSRMRWIFQTRFSASGPAAAAVSSLTRRTLKVNISRLLIGARFESLGIRCDCRCHVNVRRRQFTSADARFGREK